MNIIVVGDGKVGQILTEQLAAEGHDLVVVDNSESPLSDSVNSLDIMTVHGNGASRSVLLEAGVDKADLLITTTESDELNLLCCLVGKKLGAKGTIARVRTPEYFAQLPLIRDELGLSMALNPELAAAAEIFSVLRFPSVMTLEKFAKGRVELVELVVDERSPLVDLPLRLISHKFHVKVLVCAVRRGEDVLIPNGDFVLKAHDHISFTAAPAEVETFLRAVGVLIHKLKHVIITGGGRIAFYLARMLETINVHPKIIELSEKRCIELSETLPNALIIHGDGVNQDLLHEEGLHNADAFVALTGLDEENILVSMYARAQGAAKVVTKVSRATTVGLVGGDMLDSIVSPREVVANQVLSFVRALENSEGSAVETLYKIVGGRVEALEFRAKKDPRLENIPFSRLVLKKNLLIGCIIRDGKAIIPSGADAIRADDRVIVVTTNRHLNDLSDILN